MATLEELLAAVKALGANQREHALGLAAVTADLADVKTRLTTVGTELTDFRRETQGRFRSVDEQLAEIKDLIVGRRNGL
jgi:hypothetical protein